MQIEQVSIAIPSQLGSQAEDRASGSQAKHPMDMRIMTEQGHVLALGEDSDLGVGPSMPNSTQKWRGKEDVADRAEANRQDVRRSGVGHRLKLQRER